MGYELWAAGYELAATRNPRASARGWLGLLPLEQTAQLPNRPSARSSPEPSRKLIADSFQHSNGTGRDLLPKWPAERTLL